MGKKSTHILTLLVVLLGLLPAGIRADESDSYQNFGSTTDSATPSASESQNYSAQDTGTTWRSAVTESTSYQAGGSTDVTSGDSGGGSDDTSGGGGSTGETGGASGGHRGQGTVTEAPQNEKTSVAGAGTASPAKPTATGERTLHPAASIVVTPETTAEQQASAVPRITLYTQRATAAAGPVSVEGVRKQSTNVSVHQAAADLALRQKPHQQNTKALSWMTLGHTAIVGRLGWMTAAQSGYEAIPAYASGESLTGAIGFAMRPGAVQIGTLVPFFGWRKKKKRKFTRAWKATA